MWWIFLSDGIPYTIKTFAVEFNRSIEEVKKAIKVLKRLEMIEFTEDKVFKIKNWEKHQNVEGLERLRNENNRRVAKHRAKKREDKFKNEEEANDNGLEIDEDNNSSAFGQANENGNNFSNRNDIENAADIIGDNSNDNSSVKNNDESNVIGSKNSNVKINDENSVIGSDKSNAKSSVICSYNNNVNCNVTGNANNSNCNITVMEQNKKEIKNKKKIKRESNNTKNIKNKISTKSKEGEILDENKVSENKTLSKCGNSNNSQIVDIASDNHMNFEEGKKDITNKHMNFKQENKAIADEHSNSNDGNKASGTQSVNSKALEILMHYEKLTGIPGVFNPGSIALAIDMHGEKFVKMAINKSLELNKKDMPYINGILKNWRREGYPKDDEEVKKDGTRSTGKSNSADKNEFAGFKPKESRKLTEAERKRAEANLI